MKGDSDRPQHPVPATGGRGEASNVTGAGLAERQVQGKKSLVEFKK
jgi:hypothetical protein